MTLSNEVKEKYIYKIFLESTLLHILRILRVGLEIIILGEVSQRKTNMVSLMWNLIFLKSTNVISKTEAGL